MPQAVIDKSPMVKICGLTRFEDASLAVELGAGALGFNFYPGSPRFLDFANAESIITKLKAQIKSAQEESDQVEPTQSPLFVGVVVNPRIEDLKLVLETGVNALQFHGQEAPEIIEGMRDLRHESIQVIKAIRLGGSNSDFSVSTALKEWRSVADLFLLDAFSSEQWGGTGAQISSDILRSFKELIKSSFLAGGLTPENVSEKIQAFSPYGLDVASGIESSPGLKDPVKMRRFFEVVKPHYSLAAR